MHTVVCIKVTADTAELRPDPVTGEPLLDAAPQRISTFDEHALEEAVRLKESRGGHVTVLTLASDPPPDLLLKALAMGADEVVVIDDPTARGADALATAIVLAAAVRRIGPCDLVLCGDGSLDAYARQVGPRLAEELALPVLTQVSRVETGDGGLEVERTLDDRTERLAVTLPALLAVGQEINTPRLPTVLQILGAGRKPRAAWTLQTLGFAAGVAAADLAGVETLDVKAPPTSRRRIDVAGDDPTQMARNLAHALVAEGVVRRT